MCKLSLQKTIFKKILKGMMIQLCIINYTAESLSGTLL